MDKAALLRSVGVDYDSAMTRFRNNEQMYFKYLFRLPEEPLVVEANEAFDANDFEKAKIAVHTLKGVLGNLSVSILFRSICDVMELLRAGANEPARSLYNDDFCRKYYAVIDVIRQVRD